MERRVETGKVRLKNRDKAGGREQMGEKGEKMSRERKRRQDERKNGESRSQKG